MPMPKKPKEKTNTDEVTFDQFREEIINDYRIACESREASLLGRKEVLTGKAKFGIFGDGKEIAQIAMAKQFRNGDFRSGYYRDQTFMMAAGLLTLKEFFAQLYSNPDIEADPASGGRQMNAHVATRSLHDDGSWKDLTLSKNSSADMSPTGGQMPRLLGLAYASKFYRENEDLSRHKGFSVEGNEVAFGTIGDASTSEGLFFETVNAAGVLQVPMVLSVWDDGHGISVAKKYQTTKESISEVLKGFQRDENGEGYEIIRVMGWDYAKLCETYKNAVEIAREQHRPILIHVDEMTQPQGHSTSGSHERYKSKDRLQWEDDFDCIKKMREWLLKYAIAEKTELEEIEETVKKTVREEQKEAWQDFLNPIKQELREVAELIREISTKSSNSQGIEKLLNELESNPTPERKDSLLTAKKVLRLARGEDLAESQQLIDWIQESKAANYNRYNTYLYSHSTQAANLVKVTPPNYVQDAQQVDGRVVLKDNFDAILAKYPEALIFGEDAGKIGGVNQGLEGLQDKYGELRVFDTGIRETTIIGQAIGLALRGLRPIAEIQYLDYLLYAIQVLSDDLATLQYRTKGGQKAPVIIRTRGHRLEGIWHSGSPLGMIINSLRGIHICVPRNMTQAAGFYNTLLQSDEPGMVIESLNGYRLKEKQPDNLGDFTVPLGVPEVLREGNDVTVVTYGSLVRMAIDGARQLEEVGISVEVIDVQTLLPFDTGNLIVESLKKTNKILFLDEDVPGGASAFMMQKVLEEQGGFYHLDTEPKTLAAQEHRPSYGSDEDIFDSVYGMMHEGDPIQYPLMY